MAMIIQYKIGYQQVKGFHFTEYSNDWKSLLLCSLFEKSRWISVQFLMGQCYRNNLKNLASLLAVSLEKPQNKWTRIIKSPAAFDPFRSNLSHVGWSSVCMWQAYPHTLCTVSALWINRSVWPRGHYAVNLAVFTIPKFTVAVVLVLQISFQNKKGDTADQTLCWHFSIQVGGIMPTPALSLYVFSTSAFFCFHPFKWR